MPGSTESAHGHPRLPPTPSDPSWAGGSVGSFPLRCCYSFPHSVTIWEPPLLRCRGAQGAFFLQFPEHLLGPGLELGAVIRDKPMSVSLGTVYLRECPSAHLVADSGTGKVLGTRPVGANKANRIPNPLEFTTWEGRQI